jgi:hypothetical protein
MKQWFLALALLTATGPALAQQVPATPVNPGTVRPTVTPTPGVTTPSNAFFGTPDFFARSQFLPNSFSPTFFSPSFGGFGSTFPFNPFFGAVNTFTPYTGPINPPLPPTPTPATAGARVLGVNTVAASPARTVRTRNGRTLLAQRASVARRLRKMMRVEPFLRGTVLKVNDDGTILVRVQSGDVSINRTYAPENVFFFNGADVNSAFLSRDLVHPGLRVLVPDRPSVTA